MPRIPQLLLAVAAGLAIGSCEKKTTPTEPDPTPVATTTITLTASGASPKNIEVAVGSRVRFVNNDGRSHNMSSDPHPEHDACPELNQVGFLVAGQSRETGNLVQPRTCGFHDHDLPNATGFQGRIVIKEPGEAPRRSSSPSPPAPG